MHDPRVLLDPATDAVRRLARRGFALDVTALEKLLSARNAAIHRGDEARAESKRTATSVRSASPDERPALVERARELKTVVADAETEARDLDAQLQDLLMGIPNLPADDVPDGSSDDDAELIRTVGEPPVLDFAPLDHVDLAREARHPRSAAGDEARGPSVRRAAREGREAGARAGSLLPGPRRGERLHRVLGANARQPGDDDRHGPAAEVRAGPVQDRRRGPRAVPHPDGRGAADEPARPRDAGRRRSPARLHRAHPVLPVGSRLVRPRHPRADPDARVLARSNWCGSWRRRRRATSWNCS